MVTRSALYPSSPSATLEKNCIEYHVHAMPRKCIAMLINFTAGGTWSDPRRSLPPPPPEWRCLAGCRIGPRAGWRTACFTAAQTHTRNQSLPAQSFSIASTPNTFCSSQQLSPSHPPSLLPPPLRSRSRSRSKRRPSKFPNETLFIVGESLSGNSGKIQAFLT